MSLNRATFYKTSLVSDHNRVFREKVIDLSGEQPRYGFRRLTALIRRSGDTVNEKRVQRVRRREGLQVRRRQRKTRRLGSAGSERRHASQTNEGWSWGLVHEMIEHGRRFRILSLIYEYTRRCLMQ